MLKKDYAKKLETAIRAIEYVYYDRCDYTEDEAHRSALSDVGMTEKDYQAIRAEARK